MRAHSPAFTVLNLFSHPIVTTVDSWLGSTLLYEDVPIDSGQITYDDTGTLKRRLTLAVPARLPGNVNLDPGNDPRAPLAAYGQRLHVQTGIGYPGGGVEMFDHGWYLINGWSRTGDDALAIDASDLAMLLADDLLTAPSSPAAGATYASEFARLLDGLFTVRIDSGLADKPIPISNVWQSDRTQSINALCAAWPARWYIGDDGYAHVAPPYPAVDNTSSPVVTFTDGVDGTVIARARGLQRGALFNVVVVDGKAPDTGTAAPHSVKQITSATSPIYPAGPYGKVVRAIQSDLITTQAQADATAAAQLALWSSHGRAESADVIPDATIQLGDIAALYSGQSADRFVGRITAITLPLTASGPMNVSVTNVPPDS